MKKYELVTSMFDAVFHEYADDEDDLESNLIEYVLSLPANAGEKLGASLKKLSEMKDDQRDELLDELDFSWSFTEPDKFFSALADVVLTLSDR